MSTDPYDPHGSGDIHVEHYDLDLTYRVASNRLAGTAVLRVRALTDLSEVVLDLAGLRVKAVDRRRRRAGAVQPPGDRLRLRLAAPVAAGGLVEVSVRYEGHPEPVPERLGHGRLGGADRRRPRRQPADRRLVVVPVQRPAGGPGRPTAPP